VAQYFTEDFADFPAAWTERYNAPTTGAYSVTGGNLQLPVGKSADLSARTWTAIDADADRANVEVLAKLQCCTTLTAASYPIIVRASGVDEAADYWAISVQPNVGRLRVAAAAATDIPTNIGAIFDYGALAAGELFWLRLRVNTAAGTTTYSAKIWRDSVAEPGSWQITGTNTTYTQAAGWVGFNAYGSGASNDHVVLQVGVGTAGDAAPATDPALALAVSTTVATTNGDDTSSVTGSAASPSVDVSTTVATTNGGDTAAITGFAASAGVKLLIGLDLDRGAEAASLTGLRWVVFAADLSTSLASGTGLTTDAGGVASITVAGSGYVVGDYVPVLIADYNAATAAVDRTVRSMFGFVPAVAAP